MRMLWYYDGKEKMGETPYKIALFTVVKLMQINLQKRLTMVVLLM